MAKDGIYKDFKRKEVEIALFRACDRAYAPDWIYELLDEALTDKGWKHMRDYNGCTLVEDPTHPYVPCFLHDWMWRTGKGGALADKIFFHTQCLFGMKHSQAFRRYLGVRIGWFAWFKWKYILRDLKLKATPGMLKAEKELNL